MPARLRYIFSMSFLLIYLLGSAQSIKSVEQFEKQLDEARQLLRIPGMTAAVAMGDSIIWAKGFGQADVEKNLPATVSTTYHVASVTKTFASFVLMRLVEAGKVSLDDPMTKYTSNFPSGVQVKHVLTHTSEGVPGSLYSYNGYRFSFLDAVITKASGKSFAELVQEQILEPLQLRSTVPHATLQEYFTYVHEHPAWEKRYQTVFQHLAQPYQLDEQQQPYKSFYEPYSGVSAGIISSVTDLIRYSAAIDEGKLISPATQQQIFTPFQTNDGTAIPYGYGWSIQKYHGVQLFWHYGQDRSNSALLLKIPAQKLTFVILANSINLSLPFTLGAGDVTRSLFAQYFLQQFVFPTTLQRTMDWNANTKTVQKQWQSVQKKGFQDFYLNQLLAQASVHSLMNDSVKSASLHTLYFQLSGKHLPDGVTRHSIAAIEKVGDNQDLSKSFSLARETDLKVLAVGEISPFDAHQNWDYGWIEDDQGNKVWGMNWQNTRGAGLEPKTRLADATITLPQGSYRLRYKSDDGYSYNRWGTTPPELPFYGIAVYLEK